MTDASGCRNRSSSRCRTRSTRWTPSCSSRSAWRSMLLPRQATAARAGGRSRLRPDRPAHHAGAEGRGRRGGPGLRPSALRRAMAENFGADRVRQCASIVEWSKGGCPLVIEATNSPFGFRDAVRAARIGGRIVLVGIPDGDTYTLPAAPARRRGLKIKFAGAWETSIRSRSSSSRRGGRCAFDRHPPSRAGGSAGCVRGSCRQRSRLWQGPHRPEEALNRRSCAGAG